MDDLISRQDAIDAIKEFQHGAAEWKGEQEERSDIWHRADSAIASAIEIKLRVKKIPSAQQWIPCSERLPPELKPVNVTWINRQPPTYYEKIKDKPFTDTAVYYEGKWYWQSVLCVDMLKEYGESPADDVAHEIEIVAWMPLPEPYKGEANG